MKNNKAFLPLIYSIIFIILLNAIGSFLYFRYDLTTEKRYTLSEETKKVLRNLDDIIYIKVYLKGEYPAGFKRLEKQSREILQNFKNIARNKLDFEFINPSESNSKKQRDQVYKQLVQQGLHPTDLQVKEKTGMSSSIIFPGAVIYYKEKYSAIELLKKEPGAPPQVALNNSIEMLEYEFISTISKLTKSRKEKIAFLSGHKELNEREVADISYSVLSDNYSLSEYYDLQHFDITEFQVDSITNEPDLVKQLQKLKSFKAIIIAKPQMPFNNLDKLLIDQYIMTGGNILWLLDGVNANMDSLRISKGYFMAKKKQLNLDDMLFKYGLRVNADLLQDKRATEIPIITGYSGNTPQQSFFSWPYYPLLLSDSKHSISRNLDAIKCEFVSSIDTIENNINKTILLHSSKNARIVPSPHRVSLGIIKNPPKQEYFNNTDIPIAVLLEGEFESVFKNRIIPKNKSLNFKKQGEKAKMIVVSDGDMIRNNFSKKTGNVYPLGYDKFGEFIYPGNKTFLMNAIHYLCQNKQDLHLNSLKNKELKLRLLDREKVNKHKLYIQLINLFLPIIIIIIIALFYNYSKKKKYA
ncbi:MAG: gliding motility-associated ABC transporter substrate-binding protein GldG [Flavobacteriales bacterium]|nr:gliding motility-associated ABC transporter substrate-binding protein GldG [Flavobacteriales bacterium]